MDLQSSGSGHAVAGTGNGAWVGGDMPGVGRARGNSRSPNCCRHHHDCSKVLQFGDRILMVSG